MKRLSSILLYSIIFITLSCKKEVAKENMAVSSFTVNGNASNSMVIGAYDQYSLINNSSNAEKFQWDLGNGTTSTSREITLSYPKAGTYQLSLTAFDANGKATVSYKTIKVVDPVITEVKVKIQNLNAMPSRPVLKNPILWVEIVKAEQGIDYPITADGSFAAPVVFRSNLATNIDLANMPLLFNVPDGLLVDIPTLTRQYGYTGRGYGFNLYAKDDNGTYLLCSNFWSGFGISYLGSIPRNNFTLTVGAPGISIDFTGVYR